MILALGTRTRLVSESEQLFVMARWDNRLPIVVPGRCAVPPSRTEMEKKGVTMGRCL